MGLGQASMRQSRDDPHGQEACHELSACMLMATLGPPTAAEVLVAGVGGTTQEIATIAPLRKFTAVDPSSFHRVRVSMSQQQLLRRSLL